MKNFLVVSLSILISLNSMAQDAAPADAPPAESTDGAVAAPDPSKLAKPKSRQKTKPGSPPNDSSSFIGDPDNLDPLNVNNESLREDDEPVLEDIKDVLNSKKKKKAPPPANAAAEAPAASPSDAPAEAPATTEAPPPVVEAPPPVVEAPPPAPEPPAPTVAADDPDLALEKKFHDIYQTYNKNPTPDDIWAEASGKQTARLYEVQKGDTLWSISKILFGDPNFWPKLWAINKQGILNPHFINPKMKIYFYEGTEEEAPTLTVGENAPVEEAKETAVAAETATPEAAGGATPPPAEKPMLATEEQAVAEAGKVARSKYKPLRNIPPSLPEGRNTVYFDGSNKKKVKEMRIDLGKEPRSEFFYANDIVITDVDVKSDVVLKISEVEKMRCSPGRLFKDIVFNGSLVDQYDIYERLPGLKTSTGFKYTYRLTGTAKSYKDKYLSVVDCTSFVATDLIFVPKNQMKELATQKISDLEFPTLIGAPDNSEQKFYAPLQYAFVDFGPKTYNVGESFKLLSELTDSVNGEFKVIEKFGSYALVIMTDVKEQILIGDRVVEP